MNIISALRLAMLGGLLLLSASARPALSQTTQATFDRFSIADGLSQSTIRALVQDYLGFVWIGTEDGLNKYDGYNFTVYKPDPLSQNSISDNSITYLFESRDSVLWIGTESGGLNRFDRDGERFTAYIYNRYDNASISSNRIFVIYEDKNGTLWVGTDNGLDRFDPETGRFTHFKHDPNDATSLPSDSVYTLLEDRFGTFWVGTDRGGLAYFHQYVARADGSELGWFGRLPLFQDRDDDGFAIRDMIETNEGELWLSTGDGLAHLNSKTGDVQHYQNSPRNRFGRSEISTLRQDHHGHLWLGTQGDGLIRFNPQTRTYLQYTRNSPDPNSISDDYINYLLEDRAGKLWIGTLSGGVNRLIEEEGRFVNYRRDTSRPGTLNDNDIRAVFEDQAGRVWISTIAGGLHRLDRSNNTMVRLTNRPGYRHSVLPGVVSSIYEPPSTPGVLWLGMRGAGLSRYDTHAGQFTHYRHQPGDNTSLPDAPVHDIHEDRTGRLWLATGDGLVRLDSVDQEVRFTYFRHESVGLSGFNDVYDLYEDRRGRLWLSTRRGAARFDPNTAEFVFYFSDLDSATALSSPWITAIHQDRAGTFWIATNRGLNKLVSLPEADTREAVFERYTEQQGLPSDVVYAILEDDTGNLWLSTNRGLSRFNPNTGIFRNFNLDDGLTAYEYNQGVADRGPSGMMYFGGVDGLSSFDPSRIRDNEYPPPIVITAFRIFDEVVKKDISSGEHFTLRYRDNFFSFDFAALDYTDPLKNQYAFQMEPFDDDWNEAGTRPYAAYTNLDPGTYTFSVRGSNNDNIWNEEGISITLEILPPWWRTWFFRMTSVGLLALVLGATILVWHQSRVRNIERQRDEKIEIQRRIAERLEAERLHFARELHDGPLQMLQLAGFQFKRLEGTIYDDDSQHTLSGLRETFQHVMLTLRSICGDLRPPALVHFGLARAIQSHADKFLEQNPDINIELDFQQDTDELPDRTRLGLFRIFQEAMNNTAKHAGPCTVIVRLRLYEDYAMLEIEDDGRGFVMPERWGALAEQEHYGLLGAAERAEAIGGSLHILSSPGHYTQIRVTAPLDPPQHAAPSYSEADADVERA